MEHPYENEVKRTSNLASNSLQKLILFAILRLTGTERTSENKFVKRCRDGKRKRYSSRKVQAGECEQKTF